MKILYKLFFVLCAFAFSEASAQIQVSPGVSSDGRDFYIGYIKPSYNNISGFSGALGLYNALVLVSSYTESRITLSYFDDGTGAEITANSYHIPARSGIQVQLDLTKMTMSELGDQPQYRACHITSDHPVNVQFFSSGADASGSYLALATQALGKRYVVASYNDNPGDGAIIISGDTSYISEGVFLVVAAFNNTTVKITPNATTKGGHSGMHSGAHSTGTESPYSVSLNRGQCYFVKSASKESDVDISGSIIESNKPVAVLGGHENASLGAIDLTFEGRDFMIEQMIPYDFLDTTGYVSIPLKDSQPADPANDGAGENYRVYTLDPAGSNVQLTEAGIGLRDMPCGRLAYPASERFGITNPVELHSTNGKKFSVMMYDQRNYATNAPFPAPSMMTIIPMSRWAKSYSWYVPDYNPKSDVVNLRQYYINVIAYNEDIDGGINISVNNGALKPLKQALNVEQAIKSIPNHPELTGLRMKVYPGSFYASSFRPFIIYSYGYQGVGFDKDTPPDADEWYSSNANPAGVKLWSGDSSKLRTVIDSQCTRWSVCAFDDRLTDPGIRTISFLHDPQGVQYSPGMQSYNCHLDPLFDLNYAGEVELDGGSSNVCFNIEIDDPLSPAYAAFLVTDNAGNVKSTESHYSPPVFSRIPNTSVLYFGGATVGKDTCISFSIKNLESLSHTVLSANLLSKNRFTISSVKPALPAVLKKNDSVAINICYSVHDTLPLQNILSVLVDCFTIPLDLSAKGISGVINATDQNFGRVDTGKSVSKIISISNIGSKLFTVTKNWNLTGSNAFGIEDSASLPSTISPSASLPLKISYNPKHTGSDTATITWDTDIENPYKQSIKTYSRLTGEGISEKAKVAGSSDFITLSIRPNPVSGKNIILSIAVEESGMKEVAIYDISGGEVYSRNILFQAKLAEELDIPVSTLPNGTYYARISSDGKVVTEKFEVRR